MFRKVIDSAALLFLLVIGSSPVLAATLSPGDILVVDSGQEAVILVDPTTGDRSIVTRNIGTGSGQLFTNPTGITLDASGNILVVDSGLKGVILVDPTTGNRSIVSHNTGMGTGQLFTNPTSLALDASGNILVADSGLKGVILVDPTTGNRSIVSHSSVGSGGIDFINPTGILVIPIPEPTTLLLGAMGSIGLMLRRR